MSPSKTSKRSPRRVCDIAWFPISTPKPKASPSSRSSRKSWRWFRAGRATDYFEMQLGNYAILQELSSKSFLSRDASGRKIVLKALPADCLLEGQLNPNIADRLRRVREIAVTDVANLRGVERLNDGPFLVWDFVEAVPLLHYAATLDDDGVRRLCDELRRTVDRFHATGLIHGALH